ncbi:glutathione S-transferase C-terminal domain-containing protein [Duganella margarita]|uniref:glutathione S-transferase C-terminal domain-containing protein n=1 Tax=Duganella margarita TaxID=2692170 RepID=UPI001E44EE4F|nr:glutathione S-transferase C-terminal domain-containing protein [Duganella margarita]
MIIDCDVTPAAGDQLSACDGGKNGLGTDNGLIARDTVSGGQHLFQPGDIHLGKFADFELDRVGKIVCFRRHLDTLDGAPSLTCTTPLQQGIIHMMSKRAEIELLDAISVYFHHGTPGLGPSVELYQNPEWGFRQRDKAIRGMHYFDTVLQHQPFIAGAEFSMADITVIGGLVFAAIVKLEIPAECRALLAWYERMKQRESVITQPAFSS